MKMTTKFFPQRTFAIKDEACSLASIAFFLFVAAIEARECLDVNVYTE